MLFRSSLPSSRPATSPPSAYLFPALFARVPLNAGLQALSVIASCRGESARQSGSRPNTAVRWPTIGKRRKISTYVKRVHNSRRISTSIFSALKSLWNQHLQKNREGAVHFLAAAFRQAEQPMINSRTAKRAFFARKSCTSGAFGR